MFNFDLSGVCLEINHDISLNLIIVLQVNNDNRRQGIQKAVDGETSIWLTVMLDAYHDFVLSPVGKHEH